MSIAQHAERILAAWNVADPEKFETELESALHCCQKKTATNILEMEQREVLESVVERLRGGKTAGHSNRSSSAQGLSAGFCLITAFESPDGRLAPAPESLFTLTAVTLTATLASPTHQPPLDVTYAAIPRARITPIPPRSLSLRISRVNKFHSLRPFAAHLLII